MRTKRSNFARVIILLILFIIPLQIYCQVKIKEKVVIKPNNSSLRGTKSDSDYLPCSPWPASRYLDTLCQVVWLGNSFPIDPQQQPQRIQLNMYDFHLVDTAHYNVEILQGMDYAYFTVNGWPIKSIINNAKAIELIGDDPYYAQNCYWPINLGYIKYFINFAPYVNNRETVIYKITEIESGRYVCIKTIIVQPTFHLEKSGGQYTIYHGGRNDPSVNFVQNECPDYCNPPVYNSTLNYEIIEGSQYGSLKRDWSGYYYYEADGENPETEGDVVFRISSPIAGYIDYPFKVLHSYESYYANFSKPNLAFGDTVEIIIIKLDVMGNQVDLIPESTFEVGFIDGCDYGDILTSDNETGKYFSGITGQIRMIVNQSINSDSVLLKLRIGIQEPEGVPTGTIKMKNGTAKVKSIKKVLTCSSEAFIYDKYCFLNGVIKSNSDFQIKVTIAQNSIRPAKTGGVYTTTGKVKVTSGGNPVPVPNQRVKITINRTEHSGGHDHDNSTDLSLWGKLTVGSTKGNPITATTDNNGEINISEIYASEFGGEYSVEASLESNSSTKDKVDITFKVQDLYPLPTSIYYDKIGGTPYHYGPPSKPNDDHNHWAQKNVIENITELATLWKICFPYEIKLQINDMSLPYGGRFDVSGQWKGEHSEHRTGKNIDINTENVFYYYDVIKKREGLQVRIPRNEPSNTANGYPDINGNKIKFGPNTKSNLIGNFEFEKLCKFYEGTPRIHKSNTKEEHYHISF